MKKTNSLSIGTETFTHDNPSNMLIVGDEKYTKAKIKQYVSFLKKNDKELIVNEVLTLKSLIKLTSEIEKRKAKMNKAEANSVAQYKEKTKKSLPTIVVKINSEIIAQPEAEAIISKALSETRYMSILFVISTDDKIKIPVRLRECCIVVSSVE